MSSLPTVSDLTLGVSGLFLIDKPGGITSHDVVDWVRWQTGQKRVGHAGTLDPLATGLLIVLVGRDFTRKQSQFLKLDKEYQCRARLGIETDTYDIEGLITRQAPWQEIKSINQEKVTQVLADHQGKIMQKVPVFSAVKVKGKKLYQLARSKRKNQITLPKLPVREVIIHKIRLNNFKLDHENRTSSFVFEVKCSSGTYIRSLVFDVGQKLKVGATVTSLRRTKIGDFCVENAIKMSGK